MSGRLSKYLVDDFEELGRRGVQVVKGAVDNPNELVSALHDDVMRLKTSKQLNRNDLRLLQQYGAGDWESTWRCRIATLSTWKRFFKIDKTSELISSWDGLTYIDGHSQIAHAKQLNAWGEPNWIHRDQRLENENLADTIQGYLALSDAGDNEYSTIFFVPKIMSAQELVSKFHETFYRQTNRYGRQINSTFSNEDDFYMFNELELEWLRTHCDLFKPRLEKGDLLLWCSAMPHAGAPAVACLSSNAASLVPRLGAFVAMMPKSFAHPLQLSERRALAKACCTSSHNVLYPTLFPYFKATDKSRAKLPMKAFSEDIAASRRTLIG